MEEYPLVGKGLADLISREPGLEVCAIIRGVPGAVEEIELLQPDLVILGALPHELGILEMIHQIRQVSATLKVLLFSPCYDVALAQAALAAGASGFLLQNESTGNVLQAVHEVLAGGAYVSAPLQRKLLQRSAICGMATDALPALTRREREVLDLIGQGLNWRAIAEALGISARTVAAHRTRVKVKLNFNTVSELAQNARGATGQSALEAR
jgi:DNA-binding NarL/FixJ family response regulator